MSDFEKWFNISDFDDTSIVKSPVVHISKQKCTTFKSKNSGKLNQNV